MRDTLRHQVVAVADDRRRIDQWKTVHFIRVYLVAAEQLLPPAGRQCALNKLCKKKIKKRSTMHGRHGLLRRFPAAIIMKWFRTNRSRVESNPKCRAQAGRSWEPRFCRLLWHTRCFMALGTASHRIVSVCWISFIKIWKQFVRRRRRRRLALIVRDAVYGVHVEVEHVYGRRAENDTNTHTHAPGASNGTASIDE